MRTTIASTSGSTATPTSRREFLRHLGAAAALGATCGPLAGFAAEKAVAKPEKQTLVGSNVYGWGQYAARQKKHLELNDVMSALRDSGYDYLESFLSLTAPEDNARFAEQLKAKGLQPVSMYTPARLHEAGKCDEVVGKILAAAKVCQKAGFKVICCNADPIGREKTDAELQTQAAALTALGKGLNALGMKLGVHQHLPEMANHAREFHYDFDHTQPSVVGWCYDVHWVWKGGITPLEALKQYGDRVVTWHIRQSRAGVWWEDLDTGDVDYNEVARYAQEHNLPRRFTVELALEPSTKITRSVVENHRRSREYIGRVFGA